MGRWVMVAVGVLALGAVGLAVFGPDRGGDVPAPASPVTQTTDPANLGTNPSGSASVGENPTVVRAEHWQAIAESLSEVERHVNRARLAFGDLPSDPVAPPPPPPPSAEELAAAEGEIAEVPDRAEAVGPDPAEMARATERWREWAANWSTDLDFARKKLPPEGVPLDPSLRPAYDAVRGVLSSAASLPAGSPPAEATREAWLTRQQTAIAKAREILEAARR